jgi:hypothetical protein
MVVGTIATMAVLATIPRASWQREEQFALRGCG